MVVEQCNTYNCIVTVVQDPASIDLHIKKSHTVDVNSRLYKTRLHHRLQGCDLVYMQHVEVVRIVVSCKLVQKLPSSTVTCRVCLTIYSIAMVREYMVLMGEIMATNYHMP